MYWPLGAPRVYAASRRKRKDPTATNEERVDRDNVEEKESTNILGLRIARHGHLFVTITDTALTVWQTSVCESIGVFD